MVDPVNLFLRCIKLKSVENGLDETDLSSPRRLGLSSDLWLDRVIKDVDWAA